MIMDSGCEESRFAGQTGWTTTEQSKSHKFIDKAVTFLTEKGKEMAEENTDMKEVRDQMESQTMTNIGFKAHTVCSLPLGMHEYKDINNYQTLERYQGRCFDPKSGTFTATKEGNYHVHFSVSGEEHELQLYYQCTPEREKVKKSESKKGYGTYVANLKEGETLWLKGHCSHANSKLCTSTGLPTVCFEVTSLDQ